MKSMKIKNIMCLLVILFVAILYSDTITLKNGLKIEGELLSVTADSVTVKTSAGQISIAAAEVEKIETAVAAPETTSVAPIPEMKVTVKDEGTPRSIRQVGYGCLGGVVGLAAGSLIAMQDDDCMGGGELIMVSIIVGIVLGAVVGGIY
ncbi:MAG TPA: hypothetical protein VF399_09735 [bacterium]